MLPEGMQKLFGLNGEKELKMANNIWKMLDEMSANDPEAYKNFVEKNINDGVVDAKHQKEKKQKPWKIIPSEYQLLEMEAKLEEKTVGQQSNQHMREKLDMSLNKQKWGDVRGKFAPSLRIHLNICHSGRVKNPVSKNKVEITDFQLPMLKDIESLYYSLQGPLIEKDDHYYVMIFSSSFLAGFEANPNGRRLLLSLAITYFQERLRSDKNIVSRKIDTVGLYGKQLYYGIDKTTVEIKSDNKFKYGTQVKAGEFLLEAEVDNSAKRQSELLQKSKGADQKTEASRVSREQILVKTKLDDEPAVSELPPLIPQQSKPNRVLIEVLDEKDNLEEASADTIPFEMKEKQGGCLFEFIVRGVQELSELDLEVSEEAVRLSTGGKKVEIKLCKKVNPQSVRAKLKKKAYMLSVEVRYQ